MSEKISAYIIARNEERTIERCLISLAGAVDEILIIHDGICRDRTLAIGRAHGAHIHKREQRANFNSHRAFGFKEVRYEWVLQIDADEYLSEELAAGLRELAAANNVGAYEFLWPYWDGHKVLTRCWPHKRCFFRKSALSFLGIANYVPRIAAPVVRTDLVLHHRPAYNNFSYACFREKWLPKAKIQAGSYFEDFRSIEKFNYPDGNWPWGIKFRTRFHLLAFLPDFFLTIWREMIGGAWREGARAAKFVLMAALYKAMVDYYIFSIKRER